MRRIIKRSVCVCLVGVFMFVLIKTFKTNFKSDTTNLVWVVDSITGVNETTEKRLNQILKDNGYEYEISFRCVDFFSDDKRILYPKLRS